MCEQEWICVRLAKGLKGLRPLQRNGIVWDLVICFEVEALTVICLQVKILTVGGERGNHEELSTRVKDAARSPRNLNAELWCSARRPRRLTADRPQPTQSTSRGPLHASRLQTCLPVQSHPPRTLIFRFLNFGILGFFGFRDFPTTTHCTV